jgi:PPM family protein phosphatase
LTGFDQIEHACRTDVGVRRSHNQDAYQVVLAPDAERWKEQGHFFLVADGMGGHAVGEKASAKAVRDIPHTYHKHAQEGAAAALRKAFVEANAGIHAIGQGNPEFRGMGTTASALLLRPEGAWVGHVGDSRVYRIRDGRIEQLTFDHSAVWEIARRQKVKPEELHGIRSNVILRSLGPDAFVEVDVEGPHPVRAGDAYLLCSDGLSGPLSDPEIGAVASTLPAAEACEFLVELANLRGGPDNITVLIVRVGPEPQPAAETAEAPALQVPRGKPAPWHLLSLFVGIALALGAVVLMASQLPGGRPAFALAAVFIALGLIGLGLHTRRETVAPAEESEPAPLNVYRQTRCKIELPILEKLVKAELAMKQRLQEQEQDIPWPEYQQLHDQAQDALLKGDLTAAFRGHCRAMHLLIRTFNQQRHKEETFQPVWDKHVAE